VKYASVFTVLVVLTGAAAFENAEPGKDYFDGVHWAVSTMTTIGYGDELPTTVEAKLLAMTLMLVGIGYFAVVTGSLAERFIKRGENEHIEAVVVVTEGTPPVYIPTRFEHVLTHRLDPEALMSREQGILVPHSTAG
jgi:hypothetical protein